MKKKFILFCFLGSLAATYACTETADLVEVERTVPAVSTANFPSKTVTVDTTLQLRVYYQPTNGCGRFARVQSDTINQGANRIITMQFFASYPEEGQDVVCTANAKQNLYTISFTPKNAGKHIFRFWRSDNDYLLDTVEVVAKP